MSRVTLHRIERGEPSVTMGSYLSVIDALGLALDLRDLKESRSKGRLRTLPRVIRPADYPQLKKLAWQLDEEQELSPAEALEMYERNWRHVEPALLVARERRLIKLLLESFGRRRMFV